MTSVYELPKTEPTTRQVLGYFPGIIRMARASHPFAFWTQLVSTLIGTPIAAFNVLAISYLIDALIAHQVERAYWIIGGYAVYSLIQSVRHLLAAHFTGEQNIQMKFLLEEKLKLHLLSMPASTLEHPGFQSLLRAYQEKFHAGGNSVIHVREIANGVFGLLGVSMTFLIVPLPATVLLVLALVTQYALSRWTERVHWSHLIHNTREGRRLRYYDDCTESPEKIVQLRNIVAVKSFLQHYRTFKDAFRKRQIEASKVATAAESAYELVEVIAFVVGLILISQGVMQGELKVGVVAAFMTAFQSFATRFHSLMKTFHIMKREASFFVLDELIYQVPTERDEGKEIDDTVPSLELRGVNFRYSEDSPMVLHDINITIRSGERVAIVGVNGCGKSTLLKLITRVYQPTSGTILADNEDIGKFKQSAWQRTISYLGQKRPSFSDTIQNQVRFSEYVNGNPDERYASAIDVSQLKHVIAEKPRGSETFVGTWGAMPEDKAVNLSGGGGQMLSIAQQLYRSAQVYIFDEPTSEMDAEKTEAFFTALPGALKGKTLLFVSHHLATLQVADRILVMEAGRIIEDGSHAELLQKGGRYAMLFEKQTRFYKANEPTTTGMLGGQKAGDA